MLTITDFVELGGKEKYYEEYVTEVSSNTIDETPLFDKAIFRINTLLVNYKSTAVLFTVGKYENIYWDGSNGLFYAERLLKIGNNTKLNDYVTKKYGEDILSRFYIEDIEYYPSQKMIGEVPERFKNRKKMPNEKYIVKLLKYTILRYFPPKAVIDAILTSDYEPSEINGQNGSLFSVANYLIYKGIKPNKEGMKDTIIKFLYSTGEKSRKEGVELHWRRPQ